jgi:hypothetical protein
LVIYKVYYAFTAIPVGKGLMSPFYSILGKEPLVVFLQRNRALVIAIHECCIFLGESISLPTLYRSLVMGWSDILGIVDAS